MKDSEGELRLLECGKNLQGWELLDDFVDGVDDFSSGQRAVGGGGDDIKRTFQKFFGMKSV